MWMVILTVVAFMNYKLDLYYGNHVHVADVRIYYVCVLYKVTVQCGINHIMARLESIMLQNLLIMLF